MRVPPCCGSKIVADAEGESTKEDGADAIVCEEAKQVECRYSESRNKVSKQVRVSEVEGHARSQCQDAVELR